MVCHCYNKAVFSSGKKVIFSILKDNVHFAQNNELVYPNILVSMMKLW